MVGLKRKRGKLEDGGCGGVGVGVPEEGVRGVKDKVRVLMQGWGLGYKVGEMIQVGIRRGQREPGFVPTLPPR